MIILLTMPVQGAKYSSMIFPNMFLILAIISPFLINVFTPG
jgi:hypothetical protein